MKKHWNVWVASLAMLGCVSCSQRGYEVKITNADPDKESQTLYILDMDQNPIDSVVVAKEAVTYKGQAEAMTMAYISEKENGHFRRKTKLFLQNGATLHVSFGKELTVDDNGGLNSTYSEFSSASLKIMKEAIEKTKQMMAAKADREEIINYRRGIDEKRTALWRNFVSQNSDNLAGAAVFADYCIEVRDFATFDSLKQATKLATMFPGVKKQEAFFTNLQKTSEGKMFVDFNGTTEEGKPIKLSDFVGKGKYVLVDFWASWCGPCRGEIPNLLNVNKKCSGDKFMVLGVNVWDKEDAFKKALISEKIVYPQIYASHNQDATDLYGIRGIPQIILFAPDGTIVQRDLRGEAIPAKVKEVLGK